MGEALERLIELEKDATPGPWVVEHDVLTNWAYQLRYQLKGGQVIATVANYGDAAADSDFLSALRNAAPALIGCAEALKELQRLMRRPGTGVLALQQITDAALQRLESNG